MENRYYERYILFTIENHLSHALDVELVYFRDLVFFQSGVVYFTEH